MGSVPGLGRSPGEGNGHPLQYSCLENPRGQRSLAGYSPWGCRVGHNWATNNFWNIAQTQMHVRKHHVLGKCISYLWKISSYLHLDLNLGLMAGPLVKTHKPVYHSPTFFSVTCQLCSFTQSDWTQHVGACDPCLRCSESGQETQTHLEEEGGGRKLSCSWIINL